MKLNNLRIGQQLSLAFGFVLFMMVVLNVTAGYLVEKNKQTLRKNVELLNLQKDAVAESNKLISDTVDRVEPGTVLVDKAARTINNAVTSVRAVADLITDITTASHEQSSGIQAVSQTVAKLDEITRQNAGLVEEAAAAAEGLWRQAESLSRSVSVFALPTPAVRVNVLALK